MTAQPDSDLREQLRNLPIKVDIRTDTLGRHLSYETIDEITAHLATAQTKLIEELLGRVEAAGNTTIPVVPPKDGEPIEVTNYCAGFASAITEVTALLQAQLKHTLAGEEK